MQGTNTRDDETLMEPEIDKTEVKNVPEKMIPRKEEEIRVDGYKKAGNPNSRNRWKKEAQKCVEEEIKKEEEAKTFDRAVF